MIPSRTLIRFGNSVAGLAAILPFCFLAVAPVAPLAGQQLVELVAPTYPESIPFPHQEDAEDTRMFLSKDPIGNVRSYYERELGAMASVSLSGRRNPDWDPAQAVVEDSHVFSRAVGSRLSGVEIRAVEEYSVNHPMQYPSIGPFFEVLLAGQVDGTLPETQYQSLFEQYRHLAWSHYAPSDELSPDGRRPTMDLVVFEECKERLGSSLSPEQLQTKMQQAAMAGDFDEMERLTEQMLRGAGGGGAWEDWDGCLETLEIHAYKTLITIQIGSVAAGGTR